MHSAAMAAMSAANRILGFYDMIPAMDQEAFAAGFVELLSIYPQPVLQRATSPSRGLPSVVGYPNLAKFKEHLDQWHSEHVEDLRRRGELKTREQPVKRLPPPQLVDPETPGRLAHVFVPENHPRYAQMVEWSRTAHPKWWKLGRSSDNRPGIWVAHGVWDGDTTFLENAARYADQLINRIQDGEVAA